MCLAYEMKINDEHTKNVCDLQYKIEVREKITANTSKEMSDVELTQLPRSSI